MVYYRNIRIDTAFSNEDKIIELCNKKNNLFYVYGMEVSKKSKKEHFHIVLKGTRDYSTITKDIKKIFGFTKKDIEEVLHTGERVKRTLWSNKETEDIVKSIAYALKDDNYFIHWDNNEQIDEALNNITQFKEEEHIKTLRGKVIYRLNELPQIDTMMNTDLMFSILKIFKERNLAYPSHSWIKQCMVTFYMQNPTQDINMKNIQTLYNIRDPFLENKTI